MDVEETTTKKVPDIGTWNQSNQGAGRKAFAQKFAGIG